VVASAACWAKTGTREKKRSEDPVQKKFPTQFAIGVKTHANKRWNSVLQDIGSKKTGSFSYRIKACLLPIKRELRAVSYITKKSVDRNGKNDHRKL
jgi:hypothetical protein